MSPALAGGFFTTEPPGKPYMILMTQPVLSHSVLVLKCKVVTERKLQFLPVLERCVSLHFFLFLLLPISDRRTMAND